MKTGKLIYHEKQINSGVIEFEHLYIEYLETEEEGEMEACGWGTGDGRDHYEPAWIETIYQIETVYKVIDGDGYTFEDYDEKKILQLIAETPEKRIE